MIVQRICSQRGRGTDRAHIGTALNDPNIDYTKIAQGYGLHAEGPVTNPWRESGRANRRWLTSFRRRDKGRSTWP
jgi:hypothetical protein